MKKAKKYIILGGIIITWICLMISFYKEKIQLEREKEPQVVIINSNYFWKYELGKWNKISIGDESSLYNWKKYDIYIENKYYNTYKYVFTNGKGYFFDENEESKYIPENNILINKNSFIKIIEHEEKSITDKDNKIIYNFTKKNNINYNEITVKKKYIITENSSLYIISNHYEGIDYEKIYYIAFYRKNNRNYIISKGEPQCDYSLYTVLDINKKFPNIILEYNEEEGKNYSMFQFEKDKYISATNFEESLH